MHSCFFDHYMGSQLGTYHADSINGGYGNRVEPTYLEPIHYNELAMRCIISVLSVLGVIMCIIPANVRLRAIGTPLYGLTIRVVSYGIWGR